MSFGTKGRALVLTNVSISFSINARFHSLPPYPFHTSFHPPLSFALPFFSCSLVFYRYSQYWIVIWYHTSEHWILLSKRTFSHFWEIMATYWSMTFQLYTMEMFLLMYLFYLYIFILFSLSFFYYYKEKNEYTLTPKDKQPWIEVNHIAANTGCSSWSLGSAFYLCWSTC